MTKYNSLKDYLGAVGLGVLVGCAGGKAVSDVSKLERVAEQPAEVNPYVRDLFEMVNRTFERTNITPDKELKLHDLSKGPSEVYEFRQEEKSPTAVVTRTFKLKKFSHDSAGLLPLTYLQVVTITDSLDGSGSYKWITYDEGTSTSLDGIADEGYLVKSSQGKGGRSEFEELDPIDAQARHNDVINRIFPGYGIKKPKTSAPEISPEPPKPGKRDRRGGVTRH